MTRRALFWALAGSWSTIDHRYSADGTHIAVELPLGAVRAVASA